MKLSFPLRGLMENQNYDEQPILSTARAKNVIPFDTQETRARGGQRWGTEKHNSAQVNGTNGIQYLGQSTFALGAGFPGKTQSTQVTEAFGSQSEGNDIQSQSGPVWDEHTGSATLASLTNANEVTPSLDHPGGTSWTISDGTATSAFNFTTDASTGLFEQTSNKCAIDESGLTNAGVDKISRSYILGRINYAWPDIGSNNNSTVEDLPLIEYRIKTNLTTIASLTADVPNKAAKDCHIGGIAFRINGTIDSQLTPIASSINDFYLFAWMRPAASSKQTPSNSILGVWRFVANGTNLDMTLQSDVVHTLDDTGDTNEHAMELRVSGDHCVCLWEGDEILDFFLDAALGATNEFSGIFASHIKATTPTGEDVARASRYCTFDDYTFSDSRGTVLETFTGSNGTVIPNISGTSFNGWRGTGTETANPLSGVVPSTADWTINSSATTEMNADTLETDSASKWQIQSNKATIVETGNDEASYAYALVHDSQYPGAGTTEEYSLKVAITPPDVTTSVVYDDDAFLSGIAFRIDKDTLDPVNSGSFQNMAVVGWYRPPPSSAGGTRQNVHIGVFDFSTNSTQLFEMPLTVGVATTPFGPFDTGSTGDTNERILEIRIRNNTIWVDWDGQPVIVNKFFTDNNSTEGFIQGLFHAHLKTPDANSGQSNGNRATLMPTFNDFEISNVQVFDSVLRQELLAISAGTVKVLSNESSYNTLIDGTSSSTTGLDSSVNVVRGVFFNRNHYLADSLNYRYYDTQFGKLKDWNGDSSAKSLPGGDQDRSGDSEFGANTATPDGNPRANLIALYGGRIVLNDPTSPQNLVLSRINDPFDWDTSIFSDSDNQSAVIFGSSEMGLIGDTVTCLTPYSDQAMAIGCQHELYVLIGDPGFGGALQNVSRKVGVVSGDAMVYGPDKTLYFMSETGLYRIAPNQFNIDFSNRISRHKLDRTFMKLDAEENRIQLTWDVERDGLWIFITPFATGATTHYFWDKKSESFQPQRFPDDNGPTSVMEFKSKTSDERHILMGTRSGYVIRFNKDVKNDDGGTGSAVAIDSHVLIGPINPWSDNGSVCDFDSIEVNLDEQSDDLSVDILVGDTVEGALAAVPLNLGTASAGRNNPFMIRASGYAGFIKLYNSTASQSWQLGSIQIDVSEGGEARSA